MENWKTRSRKTIMDYSKFLKIEEHSVELPDGKVIDDWPMVITPDFVIVVAITAKGQFICFRQTKYVIEGTTLAPVGGYLEPDEDPLAAAQRELREETGYTAAGWRHLGRFPVDANRGCGTAHLYLATGAQPAGGQIADDLEEQELLLLSRDEISTALHAGEFKVLPWSAALALALLVTN